METKDTVKSGEIAKILNDCFPYIGAKDRRNEAISKLVGNAEVIAEINFKAGIREVVKYIKLDIANSTRDAGRNVVLCEDGWHTVYGDTIVFVASNQEWQARLKEWGID